MRIVCMSPGVRTPRACLDSFIEMTEEGGGLERSVSVGLTFMAGMTEGGIKRIHDSFEMRSGAETQTSPGALSVSSSFVQVEGWSKELSSDQVEFFHVDIDECQGTSLLLSFFPAPFFSSLFFPTLCSLSRPAFFFSRFFFPSILRVSFFSSALSLCLSICLALSVCLSVFGLVFRSEESGASCLRGTVETVGEDFLPGGLHVRYVQRDS